ncbi:MAG TPA: IS5 family transposase [Planctomycetaceae bacterium]|nr:IS5 family transposase [Planctomycetaceae bacterium]
MRRFLPARQSRRGGRPLADHRRVINGILWILKTGSPWRDLTSEYGKWQTVYNRFRRWINEGLWNQIYDRILQRAKQLQRLENDLWCIDGTVVRAHRCASGMIEQCDENDEMTALGRSRGGHSTKLHVLTDGNGHLLSMSVSPGQSHESTEVECLLANCRLNLSRRANRPNQIAGDKGYSSSTIRSLLSERAITPVIPTRSNEPAQPDFDSRAYKRRNIVERTIGWLKESRRVATRYDKLPCSYLTFVLLAALRRLIKTGLRDST